METKPKNKVLIIIIAIVVVLGVSIAALLIKPFNKNNNETKTENTVNNNEVTDKTESEIKNEVLSAEEDPEYYEKMQSYETNESCTKKGNKCNIFDIGNGIALNIKVSDTEEYSFHVIANDENTMTLLSDDAIVNSAWSEYGENFFGPEILLKTVFEKTKGWNKVNNQELSYSDTGYKTYKANCYGEQGPEDICKSNGEGIGYELLTISSTGAIMRNSYGEEISLFSGKVYARPATYEEISELFAYNNKISWLDNTESFWTMSSTVDTYFKHNGAFAVKPSATSTLGITTTGNLITDSLGVRVVITINKEA